MNVQENLFKIYNVIKHKSQDWDKALESLKEKGELDHLTLYYAAYYGGAQDVAKILINLWNGDLSEDELDRSLKMLHNPINEKIVN